MEFDRGHGILLRMLGVAFLLLAFCWSLMVGLNMWARANGSSRDISGIVWIIVPVAAVGIGLTLRDGWAAVLAVCASALTTAYLSHITYQTTLNEGFRNGSVFVPALVATTAPSYIVLGCRRVLRWRFEWLRSR
jgi:lysylphosphatidylglycerol synthetase-like protein (DUF2156 family)